jgi:group I intron endonuclease
MNQRDYTVYIHKNKINNKKYIGITCQEPIRRWKNGNGYKDNIYFWRAIEKYGWDGFEHIIFAKKLTKKEAELMEINLIKKMKTTYRDCGYNIENGGSSIGKHSEETKRKISESNIGKRHTQESKEKMSKAKKGMVSSFKGKKHTEEAKMKNSESHKGRKNLYLTERNKIFNARATSVVQLDINGNFISQFKSIRDASSKTNVNRLCIADVCKGKQLVAGGFKWMYLNNYNSIVDEVVA